MNVIAMRLLEWESKVMTAQYSADEVVCTLPSSATVLILDRFRRINSASSGQKQTTVF